MAVLVDLYGSVFSNICMELLHSDAKTLSADYIRFVMFRSAGLVNAQFGREYGDIVICSDFKSWRKRDFKYYKWERHHDHKQSKVDWDSVMRNVRIAVDDLKKHLTFRVVECELAEGDDIMSVCARILARKEKVLIYSSDKDMVYLTGHPNIKQYSPRNKDFYTVDDPFKFEFELILKGDKSDGIPNVKSPIDFYYTTSIAKEKGEKTKRAASVSQKWIDQLWDACEHNKNNIVRAYDNGLMTSDELERFSENMRLISLDYIPNDIVENIVKAYKSWDENKSIMELMSYFAQHNLQPLMKQMDNFQPFKRLF